MYNLVTNLKEDILRKLINYQSYYEGGEIVLFQASLGKQESFQQRCHIEWMQKYYKGSEKIDEFKKY